MSNKSVFSYMLKQYFHHEQLLQRFISKATVTLVRKIIEGKLNTVADALSYRRSYVLRNKSLSLKDLYDYTLQGREWILEIVEDVENLDDDLINILYEFRNHLYGKRLKAAELKPLKENYAGWLKKQGESFIAFLRQRDAKPGTESGTESLSEGEVISF
jgi:hypothetical protein